MSEEPTKRVIFDVNTKYAFAKSFCPRLQLAARERYPFMDADEFVSWCDPATQEINKKGEKKTLEYFKLKDEYQKYIPSIENKYIPERFPSVKPGRFYANFDQEGEEYIRLTYAVFYPFNGFQVIEIGYKDDQEKEKSFHFELAPMASHQGDWENIIVFLKLKDATLKNKSEYVQDPRNWELYCVYGSGHGKCDFGLPEKYFNDEKFRKEFENRAQTIKKTGKEHKDDYLMHRTSCVDLSKILVNLEDVVTEEPRGVSLVKKVDTDDETGQHPIVYASLNGHANHFDQKDSNYSDVLVELAWVPGLLQWLLSLDTKSKVKERSAFIGKITQIKAGDYTFYGDAKDGYFSFGDGVGGDADDEKSELKSKVLDEKSVTLLFEESEGSDKWQRIDSKDGLVSDCQWASEYQNYHWGKTTTRKPVQKFFMVPPSMKLVDDPSGVIKGVQSIIEAVSKSDSDLPLPETQPAPQGPTWVNQNGKGRKWWKDQPLVKLDE